MTQSTALATPNKEESILSTPGVCLGDGLIVAYPSLGLMTVCDMVVFPIEARRLARLILQIARHPGSGKRSNCWRVDSSDPRSEVRQFCIENGDEHAPVYIDDVPLTTEQVDYYAHLLDAAVRMTESSEACRQRP